jgi:hypothetical protein
MHAYEKVLTDAEAADLLTYIRQAFALGASTLRKEEIAAARQP